MKISSIELAHGTWSAWINMAVDAGGVKQIEITSDVDFEDCLTKAREFMQRGPLWDVRNVTKAMGPACRIGAVGIEDLAEVISGDTLEDALAKGRAECERRNAERAGK